MNNVLFFSNSSYALNLEDFSVVARRVRRIVYYVFTTANRIYDARLDGERLLFERLSR